MTFFALRPVHYLELVFENPFALCFHKSLAQRHQELMDHYAASFQSITEELEIVKDRFSTLMQKDDKLRLLSLDAPDEIHQILVAYSQKDALPKQYSK